MKAGVATVGHPVNVATGVVSEMRRDFCIAGTAELSWDRLYATDRLHLAPTPLGAGWTTRYFASLLETPDGYELTTPEGYRETIPDPERAVANGRILSDLGAFQELTSSGDQFTLTRWNVDTFEIERYIFRCEERFQACRLIAIENAAGRGLDLFHDTAGRLFAIRQRIEGRALAIEYGSAGLISQIVLLAPGGRQQVLARYEYDPAGRLSAAADPIGAADRYDYDSAGRLTRGAGREGGVFFFQYDARGRCVRTSGLDRYDEKSLRYFDAALFTEVTDSLDHATLYQYLATGQVTSILDALGGETRTEYDDHGRIVSITSPVGGVTKFEYDDAGNRSVVTNALGHSFTTRFNEAHQPLERTDPNGGHWRREYDAAGRVSASVNPLGARYTYRYDGDGNLVEIVNPMGAVRHQRFVNGVLVETTDWNGNVTSLETDFMGRVTRRVNPPAGSMEFEYDPRGDPIRVTLADGTVIRAQYDPARNLIALTDGRGFTTRRRYGPCRRILERINPAGDVVRYAWGTEPDRLERVINEKGEVFEFTYDAAGRIVKEKAFDGRETLLEYDANGWCVAVTNGAGERIEIVRNLLGFVVEQRLPDGGFSRYDYDNLGRFIEATNQDIAVTVSRDAVGRVVKEVQGQHWVQSTYNLAGDRTQSETSLGFAVEYSLDPNGSPLKIATSAGPAMSFAWDEGGNEVFRSMPGGTAMEQRFDLLGRLSEQKVGARTVGGGIPRILDRDTRIRRSYLRDGAGQPVRIEDSLRGAINYTYDPVSRLISAERDGGFAESFEYDATSNVSHSRVQGVAVAEDETFFYSAGDRLATKGVTHYEYDAQGRLRRKIDHSEGEPRIWLFEWDALDQLRSVTRPDGQVWLYKYDALGRRTEKKGPLGTTDFIWNGDVLAHEVSVETGSRTSWIFSVFDHTPLAKFEGSNMFPIIADHLGTPMEMLDSRGKIVWTLNTRAYGSETKPHDGTVSNPIRFQGQYYDAESGLHYNRFRYYDPDATRFIQPDPLALAASNNLFRYALNPIVWIDPLGLLECHKSGERGRKAALKQLKDEGYENIQEEVTMVVNGKRVRADFVAEKDGEVHVFEVKNGSGRLTKNQEGSGVFDMDSPSNPGGGAIDTSQGTTGTFKVATDNRPDVGDRGDKIPATFNVLKYDK